MDDVFTEIPKFHAHRFVIDNEYKNTINVSKFLVGKCVYARDYNNLLSKLLLDGDKLLTILRMLSSEIIELRGVCHGVVRGANKIVNKNHDLSVSILTVMDMDKYYSEQGWVAHSGIISVREYVKFTDNRIRYTKETFSELLWMHEELISKAQQLYRVYSQLADIFVIHKNYIKRNMS